ncbi:MAG: hypothetical protein WKF43_12735, partial [Acidimicrobiales bacterium]
GGGGAEVAAGRLVRAWGGDGRAPLLSGLSEGLGVAGTGDPEVVGGEDPALPPARDHADELACIAGWLDREAARVRITHSEGGLASAYPGLPHFEPRPARPLAAGPPPPPPPRATTGSARR